MNNTDWDARSVLLVIAAIAVALNQVIQPILGYLTSVKVTSIGEKQKTDSAKLEVIHQSTNGGLSELQRKLDDALNEINLLKERIMKQ